MLVTEAVEGAAVPLKAMQEPGKPLTGSLNWTVKIDGHRSRGVGLPGRLIDRDGGPHIIKHTRELDSGHTRLPVYIFCRACRDVGRYGARTVHPQLERIVAWSPRRLEI